VSASRGRHPLFAVILALGVGSVCLAVDPDTLSVAAAGSLPGATARVPVYVRDVSGTTLDEGDGLHLEIQGFGFRADFPATWVTSVNFEQAGVTAGKSVLFTYVDPQSDHVTVLYLFDPTASALAFTLDRRAPGDIIGNLVFTTDGAAPLETEVPIALDDASATLSNDSGSLGETVANGMLALGDGLLTLTHDVFADGFESRDSCTWSSQTPAASCG
jgi:hypothetical protein